MNKRGRPVNHPPVQNCKTGEVYDTFTAAANDIGGSRFGVMKVCYGMQKHHYGVVFRFIEKDSQK